VGHRPARTNAYAAVRPTPRIRAAVTKSTVGGRLARSSRVSRCPVSCSRAASAVMAGAAHRPYGGSCGVTALVRSTGMALRHIVVVDVHVTVVAIGA
jgi:hypothetical protein